MRCTKNIKTKISEIFRARLFEFPHEWEQVVPRAWFPFAPTHSLHLPHIPSRSNAASAYGACAPEGKAVEVFLTTLGASAVRLIATA